MKLKFHTRRMILLSASPSLAEPVAAFYLRNRDFFRAFDPVHEESFFTSKGQKRLLKEEERQFRHDESYRFYLTLRERPGHIIGLVALNGVVRGSFQSCFLSYKIDQHCQSRGYTTEAVRAVTGIAFRDLGLHRVEANIMPRNAPSLRVAEKCGYRSEGLARNYLNINGVWEDHLHMVRLCTDRLREETAWEQPVTV